MEKYSYMKDLLGFRISQLEYEIGQSSISKQVNYINFTNPSLDIYFDEALEESEVDKLGTIVRESPDQTLIEPVSASLIQQIDLNKRTRSKSYSTLGRIIYLGSSIVGKIKTIYIVSYLDKDVDSYDIRIVDKGNESVVIAEVLGLTNTRSEIEDIVRITDFNSLPTGTTRLDIQAKANGAPKRKYIHVESLLMKY